MKAMVNVRDWRDWTASGVIIFTVMNLAAFVRFYWAALLMVALVSFIGIGKEEGWVSLLYGIGAVLVCVGIFSALATTVILLCISSLTSCDEDENKLDSRRFLQPQRQESLQYGKQFIIGAVTFLMTSAAFMGVEVAMVIGAALIVLSFCASILIKARIS